jgi:DNA-binding MarR family transcriptional regulator
MGMPPSVAPRIPPEQLAAWSTFLEAHAAVVRRIEQTLDERGLPPLTWYDVLWPVYRAPERRLRMNQLNEQAVLSRTGLVRRIDRIERAGLLRREPVPEDGRGAYAVLTAKGAEAVHQIWPVYGGEIRALFLQPLADDLGHVRSGLGRVVDAAR